MSDDSKAKSKTIETLKQEIKEARIALLNEKQSNHIKVESEIQSKKNPYQGTIQRIKLESDGNIAFKKGNKGRDSNSENQSKGGNM